MRRLFTPGKSRIQHSCLNCGKVFYIAPYLVRQGAFKYCGRECCYKAKTRPLSDRFWDKVNKTDSCWLWIGAVDQNGYGRFGNKLAHRMAWIFANGTISDDINVCHNCPNGDCPTCVRPDHMFLGTQTDNMVDAAVKGLMAKKLTAEQIVEIRARFAVGRHGIQSQLAREYGVNFATMSQIVRRRIWKHV